MNNFKELRTKMGLSQKELASVLYVNQTAVSQWERGVTTPSVNILFKLCDIYDTSIDYLLGRSSTQRAEIETDQQGIIKLKIRELRISRGLKQKEVAESLNIPPNTFNQYETGKREPDIETLQKLADFFHVTIDYLLGRPTAYSAVDTARLRIIELLDENQRIFSGEISDLGFKKKDVETWRNGESASFMSRLEEIADILNVSVSYLLGQTDDRNAPPPADGGAKIEGLDELLEIYRDLNPAKKKKLIAHARLEAEEQNESDIK